MSASGYCAWCRRPESSHAQRDRQLKVLVRASFDASKQRYGSPRIHEDLLEQHERVSRKRVIRLMQEDGLKARARKRFKGTTILSGVTRRAGARVGPRFDRRVTFDRAVWTKPLAFAADAAGQLCPFNREGPCGRGVRRAERRVITTVRTVAGVRRGEARDGRIALLRRHLRRTRVRARLRADGGTRVRLTRCHGRCRRGALQGRAAARSAVRRCAWAPRSAGTATSVVAVRRRAVRPAASGRRRGPDDTERARGCDSARARKPK